ncbi:MAG: hypothetical protein V1647_02995, partial [Pseudomonadota bacterium]
MAANKKPINKAETKATAIYGSWAVILLTPFILKMLLTITDVGEYGDNNSPAILPSIIAAIVITTSEKPPVSPARGISSVLSIPITAIELPMNMPVIVDITKQDKGKRVAPAVVL